MFYQDAGFFGRDRVFSAFSTDLKDFPLVQFIEDVVNKTDQPFTHINLGAIGEESAIVNSPTVKAGAISKALITCLFTGKLDSLRFVTLKKITNYVIRRKVWAESAITINVYNENDEIIGEGLLSFEEK